MLVLGMGFYKDQYTTATSDSQAPLVACLGHLQTGLFPVADVES